MGIYCCTNKFLFENSLIFIILFGLAPLALATYEVVGMFWVFTTDFVTKNGSSFSDWKAARDQMEKDNLYDYVYNDGSNENLPSNGCYIDVELFTKIFTPIPLPIYLIFLGKFCYSRRK